MVGPVLAWLIMGVCAYFIELHLFEITPISHPLSDVLGTDERPSLERILLGPIAFVQLFVRRNRMRRLLSPRHLGLRELPYKFVLIAFSRKSQSRDERATTFHVENDCPALAAEIKVNSESGLKNTGALVAVSHATVELRRLPCRVCCKSLLEDS